MKKTTASLIGAMTLLSCTPSLLNALTYRVTANSSIPATGWEQEANANLNLAPNTPLVFDFNIDETKLDSYVKFSLPAKGGVSYFGQNGIVPTTSYTTLSGPVTETYPNYNSFLAYDSNFNTNALSVGDWYNYGLSLISKNYVPSAMDSSLKSNLDVFVNNFTSDSMLFYANAAGANVRLQVTGFEQLTKDGDPVTPPTAVPEATSSALLLGAAATALVAARRKFRKNVSQPAAMSVTQSF